MLITELQLKDMKEVLTHLETTKEAELLEHDGSRQVFETLLMICLYGGE